MKVYELGVVIGRFQPFHTGHEEIIDTALALCDNVVVFIGSAQEEGTEKNPFSYELRKSMLHGVYGCEYNLGKLKIYPLDDINCGDNSEWGKYVLEQIMDRCGNFPDIIISGTENCRVNWFEGIDTNFDMLYCGKVTPICATQMRQFIKDNDKLSWCKYTNPKNWKKYDELKYIMDKGKDKEDET